MKQFTPEEAKDEIELLETIIKFLQNRGFAWDMVLRPVRLMYYKHQLKKLKLIAGEKNQRRQYMHIDAGFSHKIAEVVLEDDPTNKAALEIIKHPAYRVNNREFGTRDEMMRYLNRKECEQELRSELQNKLKTTGAKTPRSDGWER